MKGVIICAGRMRRRRTRSGSDNEQRALFLQITCPPSKRILNYFGHTTIGMGVTWQKLGAPYSALLDLVVSGHAAYAHCGARHGRRGEHGGEHLLEMAMHMLQKLIMGNWIKIRRGNPAYGSPTRIWPPGAERLHAFRGLLPVQFKLKQERSRTPTSENNEPLNISIEVVIPQTL